MRQRLLITASLLATMAIASCAEKDDPVPGPGVGGSMSAQIDGTSWSATGTAFYKSAGGTVVEFTGSRDATGSNPTQIAVQLTTYSGVKSYSINDSACKAFLFQNQKMYTAKSGQLNVTQDDQTSFKASFSFSATDSLNTATKTVAGSFTYRKR